MAPPHPEQVVLRQFRPAWSAQAYMRFANIPHHIHDSSYPTVDATGELPQLRQGSNLVPAGDIIPYLRESRKDLDAALSPRKAAQSEAFRGLLEHDLKYALLATRWNDKDHFEQVTRPALIQVMPFPLNRGWVYYHKRTLQTELKAVNMADVAEATRRAEQVYDALSNQLGESVWLLGTPGPTSVDALLFGHLVDAMTEPLSNSLEAHPRLLQYFQRIYNDYFRKQQFEGIVSRTAGQRENVFLVTGKLRLGSCSEKPLPRIPTATKRYEDFEAAKEEPEEQTPEELLFEQRSRNSVILAGVTVATYVLLSNLLAIEFVDEIDYDD